MSVTSPADRVPGMASVGRCLSQGRRILAQAGIETAAQEAVWILQAVLCLSPLELRLNGHRSLNAGESARLSELFARRAAREPLQYLLGSQEFCGYQFEVTPSVLIPRPETELLVQEVVQQRPSDHNGVIVDVGTGSGCLAVTLALRFSQAQLIAVDLSPAALEVAKRNAARYLVKDRIEWLEGDLLTPLAGRRGRNAVSVIVANPPYIPDEELDRLQPEVARYEPRLALAGGVDGLQVHRRLIAQAGDLLASGGLLVMEVGMGQAEAVLGEVRASGRFQAGNMRTDQAGIERVVTAIRRD